MAQEVPTTGALWADRAKASQVVNILRQHHSVQEVLLFGSVARDGIGRDIDLVVIAVDDRGYDFVDLVRDAAKRGPVYSQRRLRLRAAAYAIGGDFQRLMWHAELAVCPVELDVFVFPPDWKDHLQAFQNALPHTDSHFMENIAREAVSIA